jgi:hypothetical protein
MSCSRDGMNEVAGFVFEQLSVLDPYRSLEISLGSI